MRNSSSLAIIISLAFTLLSCKEVVITPVPVNALYKEIEGYENLSAFERDSLLKSDSLEITQMMEILGKHFVWERDSAKKPDKEHHSHREHEHEHEHDAEIPTIAELLSEFSKSQGVRLISSDVDSVYPSLEGIENSLGLILDNLSEIGFDIPSRRYAAVVWPSTRSIVVTDSVVFIALNHFLGSDSKFYTAWPEYMRVQKTPEQLPYAICEWLLAASFPFETSEHSTALSRMMYEGAMTYIKLKCVPGATLSSTLGYTTDQLDWLNKHSEQMWEAIIGKDILYSTSTTVSSRLVEPAPSTSIIMAESPGRAGRYLGYRLILNYMQNNAKTPLPYLLSPEFYNNPSSLILAQ